jgi:RHS repeat-associated protein
MANLTYDGNGNRKTRTVDSVLEEYTYDSGDKLVSVVSGGNTRTFTYDLAGRMLADSLDSRSFTWTADSRLASVSSTAGSEGYTYNPFGTRAKVGTRTFLRAGAGVTAGVLGDGNAVYTPGVSEKRGSVTTFSHSGLKNAGAQTDAPASGDPGIQSAREYDAFGAATASSGTWQGPFGYAGQFGYQTEALGLHLLGHRYYDPTLGRFLSRDPIGDGSNWYAYCDNNPAGMADPTGLLHVVVNIGPDGTGRMKVYTDLGDMLPLPGSPIPFYFPPPGTKIMDVDASNNTPNPRGNRSQRESNAPFPVEADLEIDGIYDRTRKVRTYNGVRDPVPGLGKHCLMLKDGSTAYDCGTWVHGGAGDNWRKPTLGCIRIREDDASLLHYIFGWNQGNGNRHRLSVFDARVGQ